MNNRADSNTAVGRGALFTNNSGVNNTALGRDAGHAITGSNNICIGNTGTGTDAATIRIGEPAIHVAAYIAGISGALSPGGIGVLVNSSGKLGVPASSRRVKTDIHEIAGESDGLMRLRPVAFEYKPEIDPTGLVQYGLIAEEVAEVYPDLVHLRRKRPARGGPLSPGQCPAPERSPEAAPRHREPESAAPETRRKARGRVAPLALSPAGTSRPREKRHPGARPGDSARTRARAREWLAAARSRTPARSRRYWECSFRPR